MFKKVFVSVLALGIVSGAYAEGGHLKPREEYNATKQEYNSQQRIGYGVKSGLFGIGGMLLYSATVALGGLTAPVPLIIFTVGVNVFSMQQGIKYCYPNASLPKWSGIKSKWSHFKLNPFSSKKTN